MLSDSTLEKLIEPFIRRQENLNNYVISIIAKHIMEIGKLEPSDVYKLERLLKGGSDVRKINEEIARVTKLQVNEVKALIKEVALNNYIDAKPFYDYRHLPFIPFEKNKELQNIVNSISKQTENTFKNLSRASAFMLRDPKDRTKFIPTPVAETYQKVVDEAVQYVQQGVDDFNSAMRRTMINLNDSGIRYVNYDTPTGRIYTQRLDTAVRRNLLDGVRAINQGVQDEIGKQIDADGKELTAHSNSAPDHEPIQGRQFTNEEYEKLQNAEPFKTYDSEWQKGKSFEAIERAIGTWNCRHFAYSIILGVMQPNYTDKQLKQMVEENHKGYTLPNGKHLTMYQCTQMQRKYETNIRRAKNGWIMANNSGDKELQDYYKTRVKELTKQYHTFSKDCGLSIKYSKIYVENYK